MPTSPETCAPFAGRRFSLVANTSWYLANFRHDLATALRDRCRGR
jgi:hypothetical protein